MGWADVEITTLTTITAADLNQMRDNAEHLREDLVGRVLAAVGTEFAVLDYSATYVRLRFDVGSLTWYTDWSTSAVFEPIAGNVRNLSTFGLTEGPNDLIVTLEHGTPSTYTETELFHLTTFLTADANFLGFYGEVRVNPSINVAGARYVTMVSAYKVVLSAPGP